MCFRFHSSRRIKQQGVEEILSVFAHLLLGLCVQRLYIIGPDRLNLRPWDVWQWPNYILHLIRHLFDLFWATVSTQRKVLDPKPWLSFAQGKRQICNVFSFHTCRDTTTPCYNIEWLFANCLSRTKQTCRVAVLNISLTSYIGMNVVELIIVVNTGTVAVKVAIGGRRASRPIT